MDFSLFCLFQFAWFLLLFLLASKGSYYLNRLILVNCNHLEVKFYGIVGYALQNFSHLYLFIVVD